MIKAVIFDMDGVIIDSEPIYLDLAIQFLKKYLKQDYDQEKFDKTICTAVGKSDHKLFEIVSEFLSDEYTWEEVHEKSQKEWRTFTLNYKTILKPHLINVLKDLKSQNLKLAIASSSPYDNIMQVVKECEIQDYFEYMTSGEDFKESKPNPEIYDHTIKKLGLKPDEVIAIEDSTYGIEAALQSGCTCIALEDTRFGFDQSKAHYLVKDLFQANKIINKVKSQ